MYSPIARSFTADISSLWLSPSICGESEREPSHLSNTCFSEEALNSALPQYELFFHNQTTLQKHRLHRQFLPPSIDPVLPIYLCKDRHDIQISNYISPGRDPEYKLGAWRIRDRLKTVNVAIVVCLNLATTPPDVVKPSPCARMEAWINPGSMAPLVAIAAIGKQLQKQYFLWAPRAKYRLSLDPTVEDTKKLCLSLRRSAKTDRMLFHYNGHGVPRPTNGEIWVFNKNYSQYIPLGISDIKSWVGSPAIYVLDCSNAGILLPHIASATATASVPGAQRQDVAHAESHLAANIVLAACGPNELLPMDPCLPADLFTACLTTPIKTALRWFIMQNKLTMQNAPLELADRVPGDPNNRKTPLGELHWVFTAITDTIAWNVLPQSLFQRLFRQDMVLANLFRNFFLAERILRGANCSPCSIPALPATHEHPLWDAWDWTVETCLAQLMQVESEGVIGHSRRRGEGRGEAIVVTRDVVKTVGTVTPPAVVGSRGSLETCGTGRNGEKYIKEHWALAPSCFFEEQFKAFEVWLDCGSGGMVEPGVPSPLSVKYPHGPEQLPVMLQMLLSPSHRLSALLQIRRFLDIGPWAVNLSLTLGIFPYVLRLLETTSVELRQVLVFVWAKILAVDPSCHADLLKEKGHKYFIVHLGEPTSPSVGARGNYKRKDSRQGLGSCGNGVDDCLDRSRDTSKIVGSTDGRSGFITQRGLHNTSPCGMGGSLSRNGGVSGLVHGTGESPKRSKVRSDTGLGVRDPSGFCGVSARDTPWGLDDIQSTVDFSSASEQRLLASFVLSVVVDGNRGGKVACADLGLHQRCCVLLGDPHPLLRRWLCLCLAKLTEHCDDVKATLLGDGVHEWLLPLLGDPVPEVRAAAAYALGNLLGGGEGRGQLNTGGSTPSVGESQRKYDNIRKESGGTESRGSADGIPSSSPPGVYDPEVPPGDEGDSGGGVTRLTRSQMCIRIGCQLLFCFSDGSPLVRREAVLALANLATDPLHRPLFAHVALEMAKWRETESDGYGWCCDDVKGSGGGDAWAGDRGLYGGDTYGRGSGSRKAGASGGTWLELVGRLQPALGGELEAEGYARIWFGIEEVRRRDPFAAVVDVVEALMVLVLAGQDVERDGVYSMAASSHAQGDSGDEIGGVSPENPSNCSFQRSTGGASTGDNASGWGTQVGGAPFLQCPRRDEFGPEQQQTVHVSRKRLVSYIYTWSKERFAKPLLNRSESFRTDPLSIGGATELTRQRRNTTTVHHALDLTGIESRGGLRRGGSGPAPLNSISSLHSVEYNDSGEAGSGVCLGRSQLSQSRVFPPGGETGVNNGLTSDPPAPKCRNGNPSGLGNVKDTQSEGAEHWIGLAGTSGGSVSECGADKRGRQFWGGVIKGDSSCRVESPRRNPAAAAASVSAAASVGREFEQSGILDNDSEMTSLLLFHPYETALVVADEKQSLSVWNYEEGVKFRCFRYGSGVSSQPSVPTTETLSTAPHIPSPGMRSSLPLPPFTSPLPPLSGSLLSASPLPSMSPASIGAAPVASPYLNSSSGGCGVEGRLGGSMGERRATADAEGGARLTSICWVNATEGSDRSLLLGGSDDGVIRIWSGVASKPDAGSSVASLPPKLVDAFVGVPDLVPSRRGSGLVTAWQQDTGLLYAGGNSSLIRVWDLEAERVVSAIATTPPPLSSYCSPSFPSPSLSSLNSSSSPGGVLQDTCITCLTTRPGCPLLVAGCGDGALRLFDRRVPSGFAMVSVLQAHRAWVVAAHMQRNMIDLISGSVAGDLKFWDLRRLGGSALAPGSGAAGPGGGALLRKVSAHRAAMTAMAAHDYSPLLASGSHNQFIKLFSAQGDELTTIRYHVGFLGHRIAPVSSLAFHPHRLVMAAGATDSIVSIYTSPSSTSPSWR